MKMSEILKELLKENKIELLDIEINQEYQRLYCYFSGSQIACNDFFEIYKLKSADVYPDWKENNRMSFDSFIKIINNKKIFIKDFDSMFDCTAALIKIY